MVEALLPDLTQWWAWLVLLVVAGAGVALLARLVDEVNDMWAVVVAVVAVELLIVYSGMLAVHAYDMLWPYSVRAAGVLTVLVLCVAGYFGFRGYGRFGRNDWSDEPAGGAIALGAGSVVVAGGTVIWFVIVLIDAANRALAPITVGMFLLIVGLVIVIGRSS